mmetsp:Transcript_50262/g.114186  ORF Transcript_50262/g.114186 Transcript_50262/m.114186 type:complete len:756 (-) Transcript_50262:424-2691(-)
MFGRSSSSMVFRCLVTMYAVIVAQPPGGGPPDGGPPDGAAPPDGGPPNGGAPDGSTGTTITEEEPHIVVNSHKQCTLPAGTPQTITGHIYCDNYFEFWFNGELVAKDPMTFTPHNAVQVSFEWDGVSDKEFAIMCMDYASTSGYEYTETTSAQIGDGVLMAEFSDGTVTGSAWSTFVVTHGPTDESETAGCSATNLDACVVTTATEPTGWTGAGFEVDGAWATATEYTADEAGWGRTPSWDTTASCCGTSTSPMTQATLSLNGGCSVIYTADNPDGEAVTVKQSECLNPQSVLSETRSKMIWSSNLKKDNKVLFRLKVAADASSGIQCPVCDAVVRTTQRIRREMRTLTDEEWGKVTAAMWIMKTTSQADGVAAHGASFRTYDYFVAKHLVAMLDLRGDQAHFGPMFMTWHTAFILEFENALLSVDPTILAVPYWDTTLTEPSVFTDKYFGSAPGTGTNGEVIDGAFKNWPIASNFSMGDYKNAAGETISTTYTGSKTGMLRGPDATRTETTVLRFGTSTYAYDPNDFWKCANLDSFWYDWYECVEQGSAGGMKVVSGSLHSGPHGQVGGKSSDDSGDFEDVASSPNDPIFFFHHADVDRNAFWWMHVNADKRASAYGYPTENCTGVGPYSGLNYYGQHLMDTMADAWGFSAQDLGFSDSMDLQTNADILCKVSPTTAVYTYDFITACIADGAACQATWGEQENATTTATTTAATTTTVAAVDDNTTTTTSQSQTSAATEMVASLVGGVLLVMLH